MESNTPNSEELRIIESQKEIRFHLGYTMGGKLFGKLFGKPAWRVVVRDLSLY